MTIFLSPRFIVQCDWDYSITNQSQTFWAGLKVPRSDTSYFDFLPGSLNFNDKEDAEIESSTEKFSGIYSKKNRSLHIRDSQTRHGTTFYAPLSSADNIHKKNVYAMDVSAGGLGVSSDAQGNLVVWETESYILRRPLQGHVGDIYTCKFFPSGLVVLSAGSDMQLKIWSVETGVCARTLIGHKKAITDVDFVDRGRNVVSCSKDGTCRLWDCGKNSCLFQFGTDGGAQMNALSIGTNGSLNKGNAIVGPDESGTNDKLLAVACENGVLACFCMGDKSKLFEINCASACNACTFLDSNTIICGTEKGAVFALDLRKPSSFLYQIDEDRGAITSLCVVGNGYWTSFGDGTSIHRDMNSNQNGGFAKMELSGPDCDPVSSICTDDRYLYTCCRDAKIRKYLLSS